MKFSEIDAARKLLGLGETATLAEIKNAYRIMAHQYHPDKGEDHAPGNERLMTELNLAYKLLMDYCDGYRYSFKETEAAKTRAYEEDLKQWREKWGNSI